MSRSISKALVLSFLFHYLFVLALLNPDSEPSIEKTLPVLNVLLQAWNDGIDKADSSLTESMDEVGAGAGSDAEEQRVIHSMTGPVAEVRDEVAEEQPSETLQLPRLPAINEITAEEPVEIDAVADVPAEIDVVADAPAENDKPAMSESVAVVTVANDGWSRSPGAPVSAAREPEKLPVSEQDRSMLEKKFRQWSEDFHEIAEGTTNLDWKYKGRAYSASFEQVPAEGEMGMGQVVVEITKDDGGTRFTTRMRMKNLSFSNYAQFVNRWNPNVQIHDDTTDGRFHSNSEVHLAFSRKVRPAFYGKVTTSHRGIKTSSSTGRFKRNEVFLGGLETGVKRIEMPRDYSPFPGESPPEHDQVRVFEEDTSITFYPDGSYGWRYIDSENPEERTAMSGEATYLVGARKAALHIKGVVNGRVLVYSLDGIIIEDDLVYAEQPDTVPDSDDYLGLVTDRSIEIAGPKVTGPGDLQINAAMYARRGFVVRRYSSGNNGTLSIHGSLAAGYMSATEPRFSTRIRFDERLENLRPPRFPVTDRYETVAWDGQWEAR